MRILLLRKIAVERDDLVFQDVPVLRNRPLFHDSIIGIPFLPGHKINPFLGPAGKEEIIGIAPVDSYDRSLRKEEALRNL